MKTYCKGFRIESRKHKGTKDKAYFYISPFQNIHQHIALVLNARLHNCVQFLQHSFNYWLLMQSSYYRLLLKVYYLHVTYLFSHSISHAHHTHIHILDCNFLAVFLSIVVIKLKKDRLEIIIQLFKVFPDVSTIP